MPSSRSTNTHSLTKVRERQSILVDFARVAAEATDMQRLLDIACHHVARATGVSHSKVMQFRPDRGDLLLVAGLGWSPGTVANMRLGIDMLSPPGRAYQTRDTVRISNIFEDENFRISKILRDHGICSLLNAPIAINGVVWGVLEVDSTEPGCFDEDDDVFLTGFALLLGLAMRHHDGQQERERNAEELGRKLLQADTLLTEQHHRVRNYFQMILAILATRSRKATEPQVRAEYAAMMERVTAVALAHDQLAFAGHGQTHVASRAYIEALCLGLEHACEVELRIERDIEALQLRADRAVPLGLVLNELLTNAIKHAAKDRDNARIKVRLYSQNNHAEAVLEVSDDGPGISGTREGGQGLPLIERLTAQISGRVHVETSARGTTVSVRFPLVE